VSAQYVAEVASGRPPLEIRRLAYSDLPQVIGVERRAFPTPWSLAMFVLELSKSSGICLAAVLAETGTDWGDTRYARIPKSASAEGACLPASVTEYDRRLVGYLICSRYETVWHVMNVAVAPEHRREGVASALLSELYARVGDEQARYTLEVRRSNDVAIRLYEREGFRAAGLRRRYYQDNGEDALVMWRTPATLAGSFEDVPNPGFV
jgi:ribosomal-protein-alanine N-acetyltransferase